MLETVAGNALRAAGLRQDKLNYRWTYQRHVSRLKGSGDGLRSAMEAAVGGAFESQGIMQREILIQAGLPKDGYVIDVGCGSGRLAKPLSEYLEGDYLGIDVVPDLLAYARKMVARPQWRFLPAPGLTIPEEEGRADMVCFFSVFTHLLHQESFLYLKEARRVLKPTGRIVFSFHEFSIPSHWTVFEGSLAAIGTFKPLEQFMSRDGIAAWASHLGLQIDAIFDGDKPHIPLPKPLLLENGQTFEGKGFLGQSVCVLSLQ